MSASLSRRLVAEALGTGLLVATVVGSGIMAERLAGGNVALALLANTVATGAGLVALILAFGPISGAHFNPVVTAVLAWRRVLPARQVAPYALAQLLGAVAGVAVANAMFGLPALAPSAAVRAGSPQLLGEVVATFGLVGVIVAVGRHQGPAAPFAVAAYIMAAYWFTSSTSFANPAVTVGRALSDSFAGIRPHDVPGFVAAQAAGGALAAALFGWLVPAPPRA